MDVIQLGTSIAYNDEQSLKALSPTDVTSYVFWLISTVDGIEITNLDPLVAPSNTSHSLSLALLIAYFKE